MTNILLIKDLLALIGWITCFLALFTIGKRVYPKIKLFFDGLSLSKTKRYIFIINLIIITLASFKFMKKTGPNGDEPHYLMITHSLLSDFDVELTNNYQNKDFKRFFGGSNLISHQHPLPPQNGGLYEAHEIGLPLLILPFYAIGNMTELPHRGRYTVCVLMGIIMALIAANMFSLAFEVTHKKKPALLASMVMTLTVPLFFYSFQIFPEVPAALFTIFLFRKIANYNDNNTSMSAILTGLMLAFYPWLHVKFLMLLIILFLYICYKAYKNKTYKLLSIVLALILVSALAHLYLYYKIFGNPLASFGGHGGFNFNRKIFDGLMGLFFDQEVGLLAYSPIYFLFPIGLYILWRKNKEIFFMFGAIFFSLYLVSAAYPLWWGGSCYPGRFLVPAVPLFCIPLTYSLSLMTEDKLLNRLFAFLIFLSLLVTLFLIGHPRDLFCLETGKSMLIQGHFESYDLTQFFPSYIKSSSKAYLLGLLWVIPIIGIAVNKFSKVKSL